MNTESVSGQDKASRRIQWIIASLFLDEMKQNIRKQAENQARNIQLNVIRLCFQAYLMDQTGKFTQVLPPICSNPIYDASESSVSAFESL